MSWSLQDAALVIVLVGDERAGEAAVRARRNMGGLFAWFGCIFGLVGGGYIGWWFLGIWVVNSEVIWLSWSKFLAYYCSFWGL